MVTGKVLANLQWSGDAVYTMDQAEEDGVELAYSVPSECTNLWFDGWVMMKNGIEEMRVSSRLRRLSLTSYLVRTMPSVICITLAILLQSPEMQTIP